MVLGLLRDILEVHRHLNSIWPMDITRGNHHLISSSINTFTSKLWRPLVRIRDTRRCRSINSKRYSNQQMASDTSRWPSLPDIRQ